MIQGFPFGIVRFVEVCRWNRRSGVGWHHQSHDLCQCRFRFVFKKATVHWKITFPLNIQENKCFLFGQPVMYYLHIHTFPKVLVITMLLQIARWEPSLSASIGLFLLSNNMSRDSEACYECEFRVRCTICANVFLLSQSPCHCMQLKVQNYLKLPAVWLVVCSWAQCIPQRIAAPL